MKNARLTYYTLLRAEKKIVDKSMQVAKELCSKIGANCPMCTTEKIEPMFLGLLRKITVKYYFDGGKAV